MPSSEMAPEIVCLCASCYITPLCYCIVLHFVRGRRRAAKHTLQRFCVNMTQKKDKVFEFIATCDTLSEHRELTADLMFTPPSLEYSGMEQLKRATFSSICPRSQQQISPKKNLHGKILMNRALRMRVCVGYTTVGESGRERTLKRKYFMLFKCVLYYILTAINFIR